VRLKRLELEMTTVKSLAVIALLVGGTSLALAQNGPPTGSNQPPVGTSAAPNAPGPNKAGTQHATKHHKKMHTAAKKHNKMYMSAKSTKTHKGSKLAPASNANPYIKQ
jgi:hypothetical protein